MKKTIICSIPMKDSNLVKKSVYSSNDKSLPASKSEFYFPVNSFLESTINQDDELNVILLIKDDGQGYGEVNAKTFKEELDFINSSIKARINYINIKTEFAEEMLVHKQLLKEISECLVEDSHIIADITFGPKDVPIVIFTALSFAENFLNCDIDNILYGKGNFVNGQITNTQLCDMSSLYYLTSINQDIHCDDPEKARKFFNLLLEN